MPAIPFAAVYSDLDATLLTADRRISPRTRRALDAARARGARVGVATGRTMQSARPHIDAAGADAPAILFNGARVQSLDGSLHHDAPLPGDAALAVVELCRTHGVFMNCYHGDTISIEERNETARQSAVKDGVAQQLAGDLAALVTEQAPTKILMIAPAEQIDSFMPLAARTLARLSGAARVVRSEPTYLEALAAGVSKGDGLVHATRVLGIEPSQVVAFGDGPNDIELLEAAGLGIAVDNAGAELKAAADRVCPAHDADGVAEALEQILAL